jgi:hypothetical protein
MDDRNSRKKEEAFPHRQPIVGPDPSFPRKAAKNSHHDPGKLRKDANRDSMAKERNGVTFQVTARTMKALLAFAQLSYHSSLKL